MLALARLDGNEENFSFMIAALFELGWAGLCWAGLDWVQVLVLVMQMSVSGNSPLSISFISFYHGTKSGFQNMKILLHSLCMVAIIEDAIRLTPTLLFESSGP